MALKRYEIEMDEETRTLAERATSAGGYATMKAYLTHLIRENAPKVISEYAQLKVTNENFDRFMEACKTPPTPSAKLMKVAKSIAQDGIWVEAKV
jgi:uncharacterized protein (DUF1778 family)